MVQPPSSGSSRTRAVIFDMDGLLLDSEIYWERARHEFTGSVGCRWNRAAELSVKGCNSVEWGQRIREHCGLQLSVAEIIADVSERMRQLYDAHLPLLPGAIETVRALHASYPLAIASSSPPTLIHFAMEEAGLLECFGVIVSSDEVGKGKPAPDVFLTAAERLGHAPASIAVFEDSSAGIAAAHAAGMFVVAVPNPHFPPSAEALATANAVLPSLTAFQPDMLP